jgi:hypothetical protein
MVVKVFEPKTREAGSVVRFRDAADTEHTGQVWAMGPTDGTRWVIDDKDGEAVLIRFPMKRKDRLPEPAREIERAGMWRSRVKTADRIFTAERIIATWDPDGLRATHHIDGACHLINGTEFDPWSRWDLIDVVLGKWQYNSHPVLCASCVFGLQVAA